MGSCSSRIKERDPEFYNSVIKNRSFNDKYFIQLPELEQLTQNLNEIKLQKEQNPNTNSIQKQNMKQILMRKLVQSQNIEQKMKDLKEQLTDMKAVFSLEIQYAENIPDTTAIGMCLTREDIYKHFILVQLKEDFELENENSESLLLQDQCNCLKENGIQNNLEYLDNLATSAGISKINGISNENNKNNNGYTVQKPVVNRNGENKKTQQKKPYIKTEYATGSYPQWWEVVQLVEKNSSPKRKEINLFQQNKIFEIKDLYITENHYLELSIGSKINGEQKIWGNGYLQITKEILDGDIISNLQIELKPLEKYQNEYKLDKQIILTIRLQYIAQVQNFLNKLQNSIENYNKEQNALIDHYSVKKENQQQ